MVFVSLVPFLPVPLCRSLFLSSSLSLWRSLALSLSLCPSLSIALALALLFSSLSLFPSLFLSLSLSLCLRVSLALSLSLPLSLYLSFYLDLPLHLSLSLCLSLPRVVILACTFFYPGVCEINYHFKITWRCVANPFPRSVKVENKYGNWVSAQMVLFSLGSQHQEYSSQL